MGSLLPLRVRQLRARRGSSGMEQLPFLQHLQVPPRLLQAGRTFHPGQVVRNDKADEGRVLETRFTDLADRYSPLVPSHEDGELMQKRDGLGVQVWGQCPGQAVKRVALAVDHHEGLGVVRQRQQKPDRFQKLPHDRRTAGGGFGRRGARLIGHGGHPPKRAARTTEPSASSSSSGCAGFGEMRFSSR